MKKKERSLKPKDSFLKRYLELKGEVEEEYGAHRPDPTTIIVYYLYKYTEIKEPRAIHRLLEIPLARILDRLCKMGVIMLPPKPSTPFAKQKPKVVQVHFDIEPQPDIEKSDMDKLKGFVIN